MYVHDTNVVNIHFSLCNSHKIKRNIRTSMIQLNVCSIILDEDKFLESHKNIIQSNFDNKKFIEPYYQRLELYLRIVEQR